MGDSLGRVQRMFAAALVMTVAALWPAAARAGENPPDRGAAATSAPVPQGAAGAAGAQIPAAPLRPLLQTAPATVGELTLPAQFKLGTRLIFEGGDSVVAGTWTKLVPDPHGTGQWCDATTGQTYNESDTRSGGGVGYLELSLVSVRPQALAADVRSYLLLDPQRGLIASGTGGNAVGDARALGDYWVNPVLLAGLAQQRTGALNVFRNRYTLNDRQFDAVTIDHEYNNGFSRATYDLASGILLSAATSTQGEPVWTVGAYDRPVRGKADHHLSHVRYVGTREVKVPWADEPAPAWATAGRRFNYQGSSSTAMQGGLVGALPGPAFSVSITLTGGQDGFVVAQRAIRSELGPGLPPQESTETHCYGSAMLGGLWISPRALAQLQPNAVLDEDPVTKFHTSYAGVRNGFAVIVEHGPLETNEYVYDVNSGMLAAARSTRQQGPAQVVRQFQLVP